MNNSFNNFISLGYFCSVSSELERMGFRSGSYPFDWLISSDIQGVYDLINNRFDLFLDEKLLFQCKTNPYYYKNEKYGLYFFHDFNAYKTLKEQLPAVCEKYNRRINRFYESISEKTLFIRYISDDDRDVNNKSLELIWLENHYDELIMLLKRFNKENELIFVANEGVTSDVIGPIYNVKPDKNDNVARKPFDKSHELAELFNSFSYDKREDNIAFYNKKHKNEKIKKAKKKIEKKIKKAIKKPYIHPKQY